MPAIQWVRMAGMPKNGKLGSHCWGRGGSTQFAQQLESAVTAPPLVDCVVWSQLLITNGCYSPPIDHLLTGTDSLVLGDFNAHHSLWQSGTTNTRGNQLADSISISSFAALNTDSPTRLPGDADHSSPDVLLASAFLITSSEWQTHTTMSSDHPYWITDNCHLISCPAQNLHQPQEG